MMHGEMIDTDDDGFSSAGDDDEDDNDEDSHSDDPADVYEKFCRMLHGELIDTDDDDTDFDVYNVYNDDHEDDIDDIYNDDMLLYPKCAMMDEGTHLGRHTHYAHSAVKMYYEGDGIPKNPFVPHLRKPTIWSTPVCMWQFLMGALENPLSSESALVGLFSNPIFDRSLLRTIIDFMTGPAVDQNFGNLLCFSTIRKKDIRYDPFGEHRVHWALEQHKRHLENTSEYM